MVGLAFFFEDHDVDIFSGRRLDLSAWNYAVKAAGDVDKLLIVNRTAKSLPSIDSGLDVRVETTLPQLSGRVAWAVCPHDRAENKTALWDFNHDVDWYVFGPASGWKRENTSIDLGVFIPSALSDGLHALHVATTFMLHRFKVRSWQHQ